MNLEEFKEIPDTGRYMISPRGDVWDIDKSTFVSQVTNNGYMCVNIRYQDKRVLEKTHRLVYKVFVNRISHSDKVIHKDGNQMNNHFSNLMLRGERGSRSGLMTLSLRDSSKLKTDNERAMTVWYNMMDRCYNKNSRNYQFYGNRGIGVCDPWKDKNIFSKWYTENYIEGWTLDKDILFPDSPVYSPTTCVFVPQGLNSIIAKISNPKIAYRQRLKRYILETSVNNQYISLTGKTEFECIEQLELIRQLQLEKMIWLMEDYVSKIPNSPKIDARVLKQIYNSPV